MLDSGRWILDSGRWTLDARGWTLDPGRWTLDSGLWNLGSEYYTLSLTFSEQNQNLVSDSAWLNYGKFFGCDSLRTLWSCLFRRDERFFYMAIFRNSVLTSRFKQLSWTVQRQLSTAIHFRNLSRKYWRQSPSFGQIADWLFRVAIIY